jgi:hypothetical protein
MGKFTYSREITTTEGTERFTAVEMNSYDEAIRVVDKGIYDRELDLKGKNAALGAVADTAHNEADVASASQPSNPVSSTAKRGKVLDK